jgi:hypothetical protein
MASSRGKSHDGGSEIATIRTVPETNIQRAARVPQFEHPAPRDKFWVHVASAAREPILHGWDAKSPLFDLVIEFGKTPIVEIDRLEADDTG